VKRRTRAAKKKPATKKLVTTQPAAVPPSEHDFFPRTTMVARPKWIWPNEARLALAFMVSLEHYELQPPPGAFLPVNLPGGAGKAPYPDVRASSQRAYGNRIGAFRVIRLLAEHGITGTAAIDVLSAQNCPALVTELRARKWEIAGHGHAITQVISSRMSEAEERKYIRSALQAIEGVFGRRPAGWHGPEYGESTRTPTLLAELGIQYVMDWPNDEQPYRMHTPKGSLISLPVACDLDDVYSYWHRRIAMARWKRSILDAVDQLLTDGRDSGRMLMLNLHPWLIGQPWRIGFLEEVLSEIRQREGIWYTTAGEIAAWANDRL
jgi:peptidoglycan/xylan/chitin deacetylase (PgdA/CDA1 family)